MRAAYPDRDGYVERDGVKLFFEVYGEGSKTVFFLPTWSIIHSRHWKAQIPYFARHFRVLTFDGRGNGKSDRPAGAAHYSEQEFAADCLAVMDATDTDQALLVALSRGASWSLILAADHSDRVSGIAFIGPAVELGPNHPEREGIPFEDRLVSYEGWHKYNAHYWRSNYRDFIEFFFTQVFSEPHSTKQIEDCVGWGLETTPETLIDTVLSRGFLDEQETRDLAARVHCPALVLHGDEDRVRSWTLGRALADATGGSFVSLEGSGHCPHARDPVAVNILLRNFADPRPPIRRSWSRGRNRKKRVLYISSPIGLGHGQRDVAIARELRSLVPDLDIDWLAQHPVTSVLEGEGERVHPASKYLANESGHIESESAEHDLHCFQAWRRMDEILIANFMVFNDIVDEEYYDLWIADEGWELDYYLHENPELKRASFAWLTDFVGWLPMPDGGVRERFLTSDYNAEMIEHIDRYPRIRDRAIFVGNPDDIVPDSFGPELPLIREWTEAHYEFSGYISGFDPYELADRDALRDELGYRPDEKVCIVTVGGSGVGGDLLRLVMASFDAARQAVPELRMIVVCGPRIDPDSLPRAPGLEVLAYVHNLYRHLAACDLAVVQGGLTTAMELTANRRPFIYFPLRHHFEQNFHVRYRLERYGAGRAMDFGTATPDSVAAAIAAEIGREVDYLPVERDGAARAAAHLAELL
jgi:pimeloyl-ACP methyl ester carboxylesterase/predicted glycosyltransferase